MSDLIPITSAPDDRNLQRPQVQPPASGNLTPLTKAPEGRNYMPDPSALPTQAKSLIDRATAAGIDLDDELEMDKLHASMYLGQMMGMTPDHVYENFDSVLEAWNEEPMETRTALGAFWGEFKTSFKQLKANNQAFNLIFADGDMEQYDEYMKYLETIDPSEMKNLPLFQKAAASVGTLLPSMGASTLGGIGGAGAAMLFSGGFGAAAGFKAGASLVSYRMTAGSIFGEAVRTEVPGTDGKTIYTLFADEPEKQKKVLGILKAIALVAAAPAAAVEVVQLDALSGGKALGGRIQHFSDRIIKGTLSPKNVINRFTAWLMIHGANILEETGEEIIQELIEMGSVELIKEVLNDEEGLDIPAATKEEWAGTMKEVLITTVLGVGIIGLPGSISQSLNLGVQKEEQLFNVSEDVPEINLDSLIPPERAANAAERAHAEAQFTTARTGQGRLAPIDVWEDESGKKHVVDGQAGYEVLQENGLNKGRIRIVEKPGVTEVTSDETIVTPESVTRDEYVRTEVYTQAEAENKQTQLNRDLFRQQVVENLPNVTEQDIDKGLALVDVFAKYRGMTTDRFLQEAFSPEAVLYKEAIPGAKAAVEFDGSKARMVFTSASDFSSLVHEFSHVARQWLKPGEVKDLEMFYRARFGREGAFGVSEVEIEERFAKDFEEYLRSGKAPDQRIASLFAQIAALLREVLDKVRGLPSVPAEVQAVLDRVFSGEDSTIENDAEIQAALKRAHDIAEQVKKGILPWAEVEDKRIEYDQLSNELTRINELEKKDGGNKARRASLEEKMKSLEPFLEDEREEAARIATEGEHPVPDSVLQDYFDRPWASEEITMRTAVTAIDDLLAETQEYTAKQIEDYATSEFYWFNKPEKMKEDFFNAIPEDPEKRFEFFTEVKLRGWVQPQKDSEQFLQDINTDDGLRDVLGRVNGWQVSGWGFHRVMISAIIREERGLAATEKQLAFVRKLINNNPEKWQRIFNRAEESQDPDLLRNRQSEEAFEKIQMLMQPADNKHEFLLTTDIQSEISNEIAAREEKISQDEKDPIELWRAGIVYNEKIINLLEHLKAGKNYFTNKDSTQKAIVHPSSREDFKWQVSFFDDAGPYSHANSDKIAGDATAWNPSIEGALYSNGMIPAEYKTKTLFQAVETERESLVEEITADGTKFNFYVNPEKGTATLARIQIPEDLRGLGKATIAMVKTVEFADKHGLRVDLTPSDSFGSNESRLVKFYKRFGFLENKGKDKDYEIGNTMYRPPATRTLFQMEHKPIQVDIDYIRDMPPKKALSSPDAVALNNAKTEIKNILWDNGILSDDVLYSLRGETIKEMDGSIIEECLAKIGDLRTLEEIVEEHIDEDLTADDIEEFTPSDDVFEWAKVAKGITGDINEAGYILPDGTLLDFSGKREGGMPGERAEDHRQLNIPVKGDISGTELMVAFQEAGAVRIDANSGMIDTEVMPSSGQLRVIEQLLEDHGEGYMDLADGTRRTQIEVNSPRKAIGAIRRFYKGEEISTTLFQPAPPIESKEFKEWFDDSRVVSDDGGPLVVHHGTDSQWFDSFDLMKVGSATDSGQLGTGFYFATDERVSKFFKRQLGVYLSLQSPLEIEDPSFNNEKMDLIADALGIKISGQNKNSSDAIRKAAISQGYDGIILDYSPTGYEHKEIVAFHASQIKAVGNHGGWDSNDDRFLYQKAEEAHETAVQKAVEDGRPVSDNVLEDYRGREWADKELERRRALREEFSWVMDLAKEAESWEELKAGIEEDPEIAELSGNIKGDDEWYQKAWHMAHVPSRKKGNKAFLNSITEDEDLRQMLRDMHESVDQMKGLGMHPRVFAAVKRGFPKSNSEITGLRTIVNRHPEVYRKALAIATENDEALSTLQYEYDTAVIEVDSIKEEGKTRDLMTLAAKIDDPALRKRALAGDMNTKELDNLATAYRTELSKLETENATNAQKAAKKAELIAVRKIRDYKKLLGKRITSKRGTGGTIDLATRKIIQNIQEQVDPNFRSDKTLTLRKEDRDAIAANPALAEIIDSKGKAFQKSLNELTIAELEELADRIKALKEMGRKIQAAKDEAKKHRRNLAAANGTREALAGEAPSEFSATGSQEFETERKTGVVGHVKAASMRPSRVIRMLFGEDSTMSDWFIRKVRSARDAMLKFVTSRHEKGKAKMTELEITAKRLADELVVDGMTFTRDQVIGIHIFMQNRRSRAAVLHGNGITYPQVVKLIGKLSNQDKAWGDWMMGEFDKNYDRFRNAYIENTNEEMGKEVNYFPMSRLGKNFENLDAEVADQMLTRNAWKVGYVDKKSTISRIEISDEHQTAIRLDATSIWHQQIEKQEHYIASGTLVMDLHAIRSKDNITNAIRQKFGDRYNKWLEKYVNDFASPNIYKSYDATSQMFSKLRRNYALAALSWNLLTIAKQAPSLTLFLSRVGPIKLMAAAGQVMANRAKWEAFVNEKDPHMKDRAMERYMEELKAQGAKGVPKKIAEMGMKPIQWVDKTVTTMGWLAVYNDQLAQGFSEEQAIEAAQAAVLETQPAARAEEVAEMYRSGEGLNWFLMFTNQINQIWNLTAFDLPHALKVGQVREAAGIVAGVMVGFASMALLSGWRPPEEDVPKEITREFIKQWVNTIPLAGGVISSGMSKWGAHGVQPFPLAEQIGEMSGYLFSDNKSRKKLVKHLEGLGKGAGILLGVPTVEPFRLLKVYKTTDEYGFAKGWMEIFGPALRPEIEEIGK